MSSEEDESIGWKYWAERSIESIKEALEGPPQHLDYFIYELEMVLGSARVLAGSGCLECTGVGRKAYASTTTWRGGIGGQAITVDICDECWGTGDRHNKGTNLAKIMSQLRNTVGSPYTAVVNNLRESYQHIKIVFPTLSPLPLPKESEVSWPDEIMREFYIVVASKTKRGPRVQVWGSPDTRDGYGVSIHLNDHDPGPLLKFIIKEPSLQAIREGAAIALEEKRGELHDLGLVELVLKKIDL